MHECQVLTNIKQSITWMLNHMIYHCLTLSPSKTIFNLCFFVFLKLLKIYHRSSSTNYILYKCQLTDKSVFCHYLLSFKTRSLYSLKELIIILQWNVVKHLFNPRRIWTDCLVLKVYNTTFTLLRNHSIYWILARDKIRSSRKQK